jgi:hypothetical protein
VCLQHFGFDFQNGDSTVKFTLHCHLRTIPVLGPGHREQDCDRARHGGIGVTHPSAA